MVGWCSFSTRGAQRGRGLASWEWAFRGCAGEEGILGLWGGRGGVWRLGCRGGVLVDWLGGLFCFIQDGQTVQEMRELKDRLGHWIGLGISSHENRGT